MQLNLRLSCYQDWIFSFTQVDKGCFMKRYEKGKFYQRTNCILEAFIIFPVLLNGTQITVTYITWSKTTGFSNFKSNWWKKKSVSKQTHTPGNPQFWANFQLCLLSSGKRFTISRLVEFIDFHGSLIKLFLEHLSKTEAPNFLSC